MHANVLATATFEEILDDLSSRFIINVPEAEQQSPERICFQVEQAHWFYEDFVRLLQPSLPSFQLKTFSEKIFKHCPLMEQWAHQHERAYANFMQYRFRIPVCGAILLNETLDQCVLVKGWSSKSGWSFPRGKINQDEEFDHCAVREVFEETGYDISPLIKDTYLEATIREQSIRLYIICGVPEDTEFRPQTRKEISQVEWFKLDELPGIKPGTKATGRFYMVVPFVW
ncbi:DCP2-domain-containing protein [Zychaea mexicana]|uniref:DCP2-domain-containing protein n=1 Tax=Zychaea mexicana TaxID=64656 RepID=UPI0022FE3ED5|nr:DCP2-domain-containing protein [Zychaea mexicana]KAI9492579.1 DCP2-domain-containing protein [Zychaea mexicana]